MSIQTCVACGREFEYYSGLSTSCLFCCNKCRDVYHGEDEYSAPDRTEWHEVEPKPPTNEEGTK